MTCMLAKIDWLIKNTRVAQSENIFGNFFGKFGNFLATLAIIFQLETSGHIVGPPPSLALAAQHFILLILLQGPSRGSVLPDSLLFSVWATF